MLTQPQQTYLNPQKGFLIKCVKLSSAPIPHQSRIKIHENKQNYIDLGDDEKS